MTAVDTRPPTGPADLDAALGGVLGRLLADPRTRTVLIAGSKDSNPKTTVLVLPPGAAAPALAVKIATTARAGAAVHREAAVLRDVHRLAPPDVAAAVPRCLDLVERDGLPVLVATAVPGRALAVDYHRWRHTSRPAAVQADLLMAGHWLGRLQATPTGPARPLGQTALDAVARLGGSTDPALLEVVADLRGRLAGAEVAATLVHGDYWAGNVLTGGWSVSGVVDWERGEAAGEPLRDQVRFVLSHALYLDRHTALGRPVRGHDGLRAGRWGDGVRYALLGAGWYPQAAQGLLRAALVRHGLPGVLWFDLALTGLAEVCATADHPDFAQRHVDLLVELAGRRPQGLP